MTPSTSTTKSARRIVLTLLAVLGTIGAGAFAYAAVRADFTIAAAPASVTVTQGDTATYTVTIQRQNFTDPVALSVTGLPAAGRATFSTSPLTGTTGSSTMKVATNHQGTTPPGTYTLTVKGTAGKLAKSTTVKLVVQSATQPSFALNVAPTSHTVAKGQDASYKVSVVRSGGFAGPVQLSVSGLPSGATASYDVNPVPSTGTDSILTVDTDAANTGTFALTITGTSGSLTRTSGATLVVNAPTPFKIAGNLTTALSPGNGSALDLAITNPFNYDMRVTALTVSIADSANAACSSLRNFEAKQIAAGQLPLTVPAGTTRTLDQLGVANRYKPQVNMLETHVNQDGCLGTQFKLQYSATGTK